MTLLLLLLIPSGLLVAGALYQIIGNWVDEIRFPPPGLLIDVDDFKLHLNRQGSGRPAVVLEAGIAASSISWSPVQTRLTQFTTVCSYDRAGLGWSQRRPCHSSPPTLKQMVGELHDLLRNAGPGAPFLLVSHSFGGLLVMAFAHAYPEQVAGLVLVDPVSLTEWANPSPAKADQIRAGARLSRRGAILARLGVVRASLSILSAGGRWLARQIGRAAAARQGLDVMRNLVKEVTKLPPQLRSSVRAHWSRRKGFLAMAEYLEALPACAAAGLKMTLPPKIPVTILSAGSATAGELRERDAWAAQSEQGRHVKIPGTGHWLQLERPELVADAVRKMVIKLQASLPGRK